MAVNQGQISILCINVYLSPNRDLCVFNVLACLTLVSLLFSAISLFPCFNF